MSVSTIPDGYHAITPYLVAKDAKAALAFYQSAFNAQPWLELNTPDGGVAHADMKIGNSHFMIADEQPEMGALSPETLGGAGVSLMIYCDDVDALFAQAIAAGGKELRAVADQFYGDRAGTLQDPFGHVWTVATQIEVLDEQELNSRMKAFFDDGD
ncbi:VOC family protein [Thalassotalea euphylliae]|uniref:VOC family protein n=1 Tax=Thalassotalea euphylliae TaxID=1655234 RepID=A0A3E0TTR4_9GAMM|nr:VOC family protein [Thalassotalea euphylliae]REL27315.1 VOC family protein [Thalassotalea euphylliae]